MNTRQVKQAPTIYTSRPYVETKGQGPAHTGPYSTYEDIGPELAMAYLERNVNNRALRQGKVDRISKSILRGRWKVTHQGIGFDVDGNLIDGQHRLWAIVEAGATVRMMVTRGLAPDANEGIDDVTNRQASDILHYRGIDAKPIEAAMAAIIAHPTVKLDRSDKVDAFIKHQDVARAVKRLFPTHKKRITVAAVLAAIGRAWYTEDHARLKRFAVVLTDGIPESPDERVIILLRDYLQTLKTVSGYEMNLELYKKTERVLKAYLTGERLTKLVAPKQELFPLPDEINPLDPEMFDASDEIE